MLNIYALNEYVEVIINSRFMEFVATLLSYSIFLIIQATFFSFQQDHVRTPVTKVWVGNIESDVKKKFSWYKNLIDSIITEPLDCDSNFLFCKQQSPFFDGNLRQRPDI